MAEIAKERNLTAGTINDHLADLIQQGQGVDLNQLVKPDAQTDIQQAIATVGHESLSQLREYLKEKYSYDAIKFVRAKWYWEQSQQTSA